MTLDGCTAAPGQLAVKAAPITPVTRERDDGDRHGDDDGHGHDGHDDGDRHGEGSGHDVHRRDVTAGLAQARAKEEEHKKTDFVLAKVDAMSPTQFSFAFDGLRAGVAYGLLFAATSPSCAHIRWHGPQLGVVVAGLPNVAVTGLAIRSKLEILGDRPAGPTFVLADDFNLDTPSDLVRTFRFSTSLPGVTAARLQIATSPFDWSAPDATCSTPTGLVDSRLFPLSSVSADTQFQYNLADAIDGTTDDATPPGAAPGSTSHGPPLASVSGASSDGPPRTLPTLRDEVQLGAPLYLRAIPVTDGRVRCDRVADGAIAPLTLVATDKPTADPPTTFDEQVPTSPVRVTPATYKRPHASDVPIGATCFQVTKTHVVRGVEFLLTDSPPDASDILLIAVSGVPSGTTVDIGRIDCYIFPKPKNPDDRGFLEGGVDTFNEIVDGFSAGVNYVATLYNDIKNAIVDAVASAVDYVGIVNCGPDSVCHKGLTAALDTGLAALGLPPSLPNFTEVVNGGVDYLAAEVTSYTNLPVSTAVQVVRAAADAAHTSTTSLNFTDWSIYYEGFTPARLRITAARTIYAPDRLLLSLKSAGAPAFRTKYIGLPNLPPASSSPGSGLRIPFSLPQNYGNIPTDPEAATPWNDIFPNSAYGARQYFYYHWINGGPKTDDLQPGPGPFNQAHKKTSGVTRKWDFCSTEKLRVPTLKLLPVFPFVSLESFPTAHWRTINTTSGTYRFTDPVQNESALC